MMAGQSAVGRHAMPRPATAAATSVEVHIPREPLLAVRQGKNLADFDCLAEASAAMFDELVWWTMALRAGRAAG